MAVDVLTSCQIGRPPPVVAGFAADPDNAPKWYENIKRVTWKTPRPLRVGSQIAFEAQFMGRRLAYTYEVAAFEPERRFVMRTAEGPFPMETTYEWSPDGAGGTRMTLRNRGEPKGFSALMAPLMGPMMRRANEKDLAKLKALLEAS